MERLWWAPGVQLEPIHHDLLSAMMGKGTVYPLELRRQRCIVQSTPAGAVGAWRGHTCSPKQQQGKVSRRLGWGQRLSHGLGDGRKPETVGSQKNQKTISHPKV